MAERGRIAGLQTVEPDMNPTLINEVELVLRQIRPAGPAPSAHQVRQVLAVVREAILGEREACARVADCIQEDAGVAIAAGIRARSQP